MEDNKVAVLLEDLRSQFRTFGDGLQLLNEKMEENQQEHQLILRELQQNHQQIRLEHQQMMQMIRELELKRVSFPL